MKQTLIHSSAQQRTATLSQHRPVTGSMGVSIAPPVYGIDFVDRQQSTAEEMTAQRYGGETSLTPEKQQENRTGLPDHLKAGIESLSGVDLSDVNVHFNSSKPAALQALAYTQGTDIHVAPGQERHLPHEAWHVVQQTQGRVQPRFQLKGEQINNDHGLEHEAEVMGTRAVQMKGEAASKTSVIRLKGHHAQQAMGYQAEGTQRSLNLIGGVVQRYSDANGYTLGDVKTILDNSHERPSPVNNVLGHPRTHVGKITKTENRVLGGNVPVNSTYKSKTDQNEAVKEAINSPAVWPTIDDLWIDPNKPTRVVIARAETVSKDVNFVSSQGKRTNTDERGISVKQKTMDHIFFIVDTMGNGRNEMDIHIQTAFPVE